MQEITEAAIDAADIFGGQISAKHIAEMLENAQPHILSQELAPLRERFVTAAGTLSAEADAFHLGPRKAALDGRGRGCPVGDVVPRRDHPEPLMTEPES